MNIIKFGPSIAEKVGGTQLRPHHRRHLYEMVVWIGDRHMNMSRARLAPARRTWVVLGPGRPRSIAVGKATLLFGPGKPSRTTRRSEPTLPCRAEVVHAVAAALVKAALESPAVIQGGESPVSEQDKNDDGGQRDEVRIATPGIIIVIILGRARIYAIRLDWVAAILLGAASALAAMPFAWGPAATTLWPALLKSTA